MQSLLFIISACAMQKGDGKMLITLFLAFLLCYLHCWKTEIKEFKNEKHNKTLKEIRKSINIDIQ